MDTKPLHTMRAPSNNELTTQESLPQNGQQMGLYVRKPVFGGLQTAKVQTSRRIGAD